MSRRHLPLAARSAPALADNVRAADRARPIYAVWELTLRCDLGCHHCGSRAGHARAGELTTEQCLDVAAQLAELGVREVTLIGGEAYLRPDWLDIIRALRGHGLDCTMTTGGRGMTRERAEGAAAAGLMSCSVSVDGTEPVHDRLRGLVGSHRAARDALVNLKAAGVPVSVNTQINRWTWRDLPQVLELLVEHHAHAWQMAMTVPMGRAADHPELLLDPYELLEVFPAIAALYPRADAENIRIFAGNNVGYFGPYEELLRRHMPQRHSAPTAHGGGLPVLRSTRRTGRRRATAGACRPFARGQARHVVRHGYEPRGLGLRGRQHHSRLRGSSCSASRQRGDGQRRRRCRSGRLGGLSERE